MLINMALTFRAVSLSLRTLTWCLPLGLDTALTSFPTPYSSPARTLDGRGEGAEEGPTSMPRRPPAHRLAAVRGAQRVRWVAGGGAGRRPDGARRAMSSVAGQAVRL